MIIHDETLTDRELGRLFIGIQAVGNQVLFL